MTRYRGDHRSQYDAGSSARLRSMGCTPVSLANGIRCATGGTVNLTGDQVLAKVPRWEETNPATEGWSLEDAALAASRIPGSPVLQIRYGSWQDVVNALGVYAVLIQGDSEEFIGGCSGAFDGDHCVLGHPDKVLGRQWLADPICPDWRLEWPSTLERYAENLFGLRIKFGVLDRAVPQEGVTPPDTGTGEEDMAIVTTNARPGEWNLTVKVDNCYALVLHNGTPIRLSKGTGKKAVTKVYIPGNQAGIVHGGDAFILGDEDPSTPDALAILFERDVNVAPVTVAPPDATGAYNEGLAVAETAVHNLPRR